MGRRLELQALLESLAPNVYFQPPPSLQMQYPCVVYARDAIATEWSGNKPYSAYTRYQVTVIDRNPRLADPRLHRNASDVYLRPRVCSRST
jgi:hypothetical protein